MCGGVGGTFTYLDLDLDLDLFLLRLLYVEQPPFGLRRAGDLHGFLQPHFLLWRMPFTKHLVGAFGMTNS